MKNDTASDERADRPWRADDGTEWVFSPGLNIWTGWEDPLLILPWPLERQEGVWTMSPEEFAEAYPEYEPGSRDWTERRG